MALTYGFFDSVNSIPQYKKSGNVVCICGAVKPTAVITGSQTKYPIFYVNPDMRPPTPLSFLCQGSASRTWQLTVDTDGAVTFARYSEAGQFIDASTSAWLPFTATWLV